MKIKNYEINTTMAFGRYLGHTIEDIIDSDFTYIIWCINNLDHFYISESVRDLITHKNPTFVFSELSNELLNIKEEKLLLQSAYDEMADQQTYCVYAGAYAQDYEGCSDDFINDALDGFADAYWNID